MAIAVTPSASPTWRRHLRFSVRGLIVVVLVIGVWFGWIVRTARLQREAVAAIKKARGHVLYDWQWKNGRAIPRGKPWAPTWLVNSLGADFFGHVAKVYLLNASDREWLELENLVQIQDLTIVDPQIGDASLVHLKRLTRLRSLVLRGENVTDAGIEQLKSLTNLEWLDLGNTQFTDAGLSHLEGLPKLSLLSLMDTQVTDAGLAHLKGLTKLRNLNLGHTRVTDAGMNDLRQALPSLKILR